jgi:hypothetical protein
MMGNHSSTKLKAFEVKIFVDDDEGYFIGIGNGWFAANLSILTSLSFCSSHTSIFRVINCLLLR